MPPNQKLTKNPKSNGSDGIWIAIPCLEFHEFTAVLVLNPGPSCFAIHTSSYDAIQKDMAGNTSAQIQDLYVFTKFSIVTEI